MPEFFRKDPTSAILLGLISAFIVAVAVAAWLYRRPGNRSLFEFEPRPLVSWGGRSVIGAIALYIGLTSVVLSSNEKGVEPSLRTTLLQVAAINLGFIALLPPLLRMSAGATAADLGLTTRDMGRNVLRGLAACALALPLIYSVMAVAVKIWTPQDHDVETAFVKDRSGATIAVAAFGAMIAAPIAEELLFRGVLLASLWKVGASPEGDEPEPGRLREPKAWNPSVDLVANAGVSMLFAAMHSGQWPAPIPLFFLSMILGEAYRRSGSLVAPIVMHVGFNTLSTGALLIASSFGLLKPPG